MVGWIHEFLSINNGTASKMVVWDTLKAGIRGETLRFAVRRNKKEKMLMNQLQGKLMDAEKELIQAINTGIGIEEIQLAVAVIKSDMGTMLAEKIAVKVSLLKKGYMSGANI